MTLHADLFGPFTVMAELWPVRLGIEEPYVSLQLTGPSPSERLMLYPTSVAELRALAETCLKYADLLEIERAKTLATVPPLPPAAPMDDIPF